MRLVATLPAVALWIANAASAAQPNTPDEPTAKAAAKAPTAAEKKAKYALPFAMRPAIAPNLLRIDAAVALLDGARVNTSLFTGGGKPFGLMPDLGFYVRAGVVRSSPDAADGATAYTNPLFFALYTPEIAPKLRMPLFAGVTAPIGSGGGDSPNVARRAAAASGIYARQAMDNALFATNYVTPTAGIGLAWVDKGFTVQGEVQVLQLLRARGGAVDSDKARTNFTSGLSVGYLIVPFLTASVEVHYQRWLSTPAAVEKNGALRDQATLGGGLRANVPLTDAILARPGISYFRGVDAPMTSAAYQIVQLDVPIAF